MTHDISEIRAVSILNRVIVAGIATALIDDGEQDKADTLLYQVRCCDHFPECSHVAEWASTAEAPLSIPEADRA